MIDAIVNDLEFARTTGKAVEITLFTGERILTGVHEVNADSNFVSLHAPQTYGDDGTTRKVGLDDITTVTVTDVDY